MVVNCSQLIRVDAVGSAIDTVENQEAPIQESVAIGCSCIERTETEAPSDRNGATLLGRVMRCEIITCSSNSLKTVLARGVNPNVQDRDGNAPLHLALKYDYVNVKKFVQILLNSGANPNAKDRDGNTPLHLALEYGSMEIKAFVEVLLAFGADPNIKNKQGESVLDVAIRQERSPAFCRLLIRHKATTEARTPLARLLFLKLPDVGQIEFYDKASKGFSNYKTFTSSLQRRVAVLVVAESDYDHRSLKEPGFGTITQIYDPKGPSQRMCERVAQTSLIFRVRVTSSDQIVRAIEKIKDRLTEEQAIVHLAVCGHGAPQSIELGAELLEAGKIEDASAITRACCSIAPFGTISLNGCTTGKGEENIARHLSRYTQYRPVFGAQEKITGIQYICSDLMVAPYFQGRSGNNIRTYLNGREIAEGRWVTQSRL